MDIKKDLERILNRHFGSSLEEATKEELYKATVISVKNILTEKRSAFKKKASEQGSKRVYYMCMEFLIGKSLKTNLCNLGLENDYRKALSKLSINLDDLYDIEPDAALGNGGLGRLAACFMDSLSTLGYSATGFSILYEYGLFRQKIVDGMQVELPDEWLSRGEAWLIPRSDRVAKVRMGGRIKEKWENNHLEIIYENAEEIEAVPYDMMISGANSEAVTLLRLWKARAPRTFNMNLFSQGQYAKSLEDSNSAEIISKVLYPSDNHTEGKLLRLTQQYFLVCASVQNIINDHMMRYGTLENFSKKVAIHINDTHPALVIPELLRVFIDDYFFDWDKAWRIVKDTVSYTNHTVMPEALESWNEDLFKLRLPRIYAIIKEINERLGKEAWDYFPGGWDTISNMSIIAGGNIRMANLSVYGSHSVNGVSKLHSQILKKDTFKSFNKMYPDRFLNVTNGIAHRRWLTFSNESLSSLIEECIGDGFKKDGEKLKELLKFKEDKSVKEKLQLIKHENKKRFSRYLENKIGRSLNTHSLFDVHAKRIHEYKRQLLNVLNIIGLYVDLKENPDMDMQPVTFIFAGKAAPGYDMAKRIIRLISALSSEIEKNKKIREKLDVIFLEDYNVSSAEILFPASEISQQISLAGKEASGTGCMKLMMNGALTIGTLDGANVEMFKAVGSDNMFIFGLSATEVENLWLSGYNSVNFYTHNTRLRKIIDTLSIGFSGESFADIVSYLLNSDRVADPYMCLADFESYRLTHSSLVKSYLDKDLWNTRSLINIASSGYFTADRCIEEYADKIWNIEKVR